MNYTLDTNIVLYLLGGRLADPLPEGQYFISIITEMELLSYSDLSSEEESEIQNFLLDISIIPLISSIKNKAIELRRNYKLKLPDAIIAASAIIVDTTLITNDHDFSQLDDLRCTPIALK